LLDVVIDANVLISSVLERDKAQREAGKEFVLRAENGELVIVLA